MEVMARFAANDDVDALGLIRTEWGYMLDSQIGTGSTFWEGYHTDGNFAGYYGTSYPASYTSLAHGWSTAPTAALSEYLVGLQPDVADGTVIIEPHPGNVKHAEAALETTDGAVRAAWDHTTSSFTLTEFLPAGFHSATVAVPLLGGESKITIDGQLVWNGHHFLGATGIGGAYQDANYVYFQAVAPGEKTFTSSRG
jgi:hypothetical protein